MKNKITAFIASSMLALTFVPASTGISQAKATYNINELQGEGFRACRAQGNTGYTAIVRGTTLNESSIFNENGFGKFYIRSCFQTKAECSNYVKSFTKRLAGVNEISYTSCKSRG